MAGIRKKAEKAAENPGKLRTISEGARQWLDRFRDKPILGDTAKELQDMIDLVNDYAEGKYRAIPKRFIVAVVGALIYVVWPIDFLPGFLLDDVLVVGIIMDLGVSAELNKYRRWRDAQKAGPHKKQEGEEEAVVKLPEWAVEKAEKAADTVANKPEETEKAAAEKPEDTEKAAAEKPEDTRENAAERTSVKERAGCEEGGAEWKKAD